MQPIREHTLTEKIDVLETLIDIIIDHEQHLDQLITRLEHITHV